MKRKCLGILLAFSLLIVHITAQAGSLPISVTLPSLSIDPSQIGQTINVPLIHRGVKKAGKYGVDADTVAAVARRKLIGQT